MLLDMRMLFISSFHPNAEGIMGAGEAISGHSIRKFIEAGYDIDVVVNAPVNQRACQDIVGGVCSYTIFKSTKISKLFSIVFNMFKGSLLSPWFYTRASLRIIKDIDRKLKTNKYDVIWIDFPSSLGILDVINDEQTNIYYFVHDVVYQKASRKILGKFLFPMVKSIELRLINKCKRIYCLSKKDSDLLSDNFRGDIFIENDINISYGIVDESIPAYNVLHDFKDKLNLVFFGNMSRRENSLSIIMFVIFSFYRIKNKNVHLWIVGISPSRFLKVIDKLFYRIHVTGPVDNPDDLFSCSNLCIAPLIFGAGVKIKVLQMLNAGACVIATDVGAEGVEITPNLIVTGFFSFPNKIDEILNGKSNCSDI